MYDGYWAFGGLEIVNTERAVARSEASGVYWYKGPRNPEIIGAFGSGADFSDVTQAPWYDADAADLSSRFYGVFGLFVSSVYDSTRSAPITERTNDGGVIGLPRRATRSTRVRAYLLATGLDALEYGRAWLATALHLEGYAQTVQQNKGEALFLSTVPTDELEFDELSRFLKETATVSGPFEVAADTAREVYGSEVEWTWASQKPFVYGPPRVTDLTLSESTEFVYDAVTNVIPYPSAELADDDSGDVFPVLATNVVTNPDVGSATGWSAAATVLTGGAVASYFTSGTSTDARAIGNNSFRARIRGNDSTTASGTARMTITNTVTVTGIPAGREVILSLWAAISLLTGDTDATMTAPAVTVEWQTAGAATIRTDTLVLDDRGIGIYTLQDAMPSNAATGIVRVSTDVAWSSGNTDPANTDARLYVDALTLGYLGGA